MEKEYENSNPNNAGKSIDTAAMLKQVLEKNSLEGVNKTDLNKVFTEAVIEQISSIKTYTFCNMHGKRAKTRMACVCAGLALGANKPDEYALGIPVNNCVSCFSPWSCFQNHQNKAKTEGLHFLVPTLEGQEFDCACNAADSGASSLVRLACTNRQVEKILHNICMLIVAQKSRDEPVVPRRYTQLTTNDYQSIMDKMGIDYTKSKVDDTNSNMKTDAMTTERNSTGSAPNLINYTTMNLANGGNTDKSSFTNDGGLDNILSQWTNEQESSSRSTTVNSDLPSIFSGFESLDPDVSEILKGVVGEKHTPSFASLSSSSLPSSSISSLEAKGTTTKAHKEPVVLEPADIDRMASEYYSSMTKRTIPLGIDAVTLATLNPTLDPTFDVTKYAMNLKLPGSIDME
eukprot:g658.t1